MKSIVFLDRISGGWEKRMEVARLFTNTESLVKPAKGPFPKSSKRFIFTPRSTSPSSG